MRMAWFVYLFVFITHFSFGIATPTDSIWFVPTALSILHEGNTNLDEYQSVIATKPSYTVATAQGHLYNHFPLAPSLIALPFVWLVDQGAIGLLDYDLYQASLHLIPLAGVELFVAANLVALTALLLYLLAREWLTTTQALLVVGIFAFCSPAWSTASRSLWQHGPSMCLLTLALYLLHQTPQRPWLAQFISLPLALAYLVRPTNILSLGAISLFVLLVYRRYALAYLAWGILLALPFLAYHLHVYDALLPPTILQTV